MDFVDLVDNGKGLNGIMSAVGAIGRFLSEGVT